MAIAQVTHSLSVLINFSLHVDHILQYWTSQLTVMTQNPIQLLHYKLFQLHEIMVLPMHEIHLNIYYLYHSTAVSAQFRGVLHAQMHAEFAL